MEISINPGASSNVVLSGTTSQAIVETRQNQAIISKSTVNVEVQRQSAQTLEVSARGPQGPSFAGAIFLDTTAISSLTSGDEGKILVWNGSTYIPKDQLDIGFTIVGGSF